MHIDLGLLLVALVFGVWGAWSGALRQALGLAFAVASILISVAASSALGKWTARMLDVRSYVGPVVAGLCALFISYFAFRLVAGAAFLVARRGEAKVPTSASRMGGFVCGVTQALLIGYVALSWSTRTEYETALVLRPYKVRPDDAWSYRLAEANSALGLLSRLETDSKLAAPSETRLAEKPNGASQQASNAAKPNIASSEGAPSVLKAAFGAKEGAEAAMKQRIEAADAVMAQ